MTLRPWTTLTPSFSDFIRPRIYLSLTLAVLFSAAKPSNANCLGSPTLGCTSMFVIISLAPMLAVYLSRPYFSHPANLNTTVSWPASAVGAPPPPAAQLSSTLQAGRVSP